MKKRKCNGEAEPQVHTNGHAAKSTRQGVASHGQGSIAAHRDLAVLNGAGDASLANGGVTAGTASAGLAAHNRTGKPASTGERYRNERGNNQPVQFPGPTNLEAMQDAGGYVNAVAERVDLVAASVRLVQCGDEKIAKAELDRLRDMKFGKVGPPPLEEQEWPELGDLPGPPR